MCVNILKFFIFISFKITSFYIPMKYKHNIVFLLILLEMNNLKMKCCLSYLWNNA